MEIRLCDTKKDLPAEQLRALFHAVGWSDGQETSEQLKNFNIGFLHSTLVVSAWDGEKLVGAVRVLSDTVFRSVVYDLIVDPLYQNKGIGTQLMHRCMQHFPNSEWLVQTTSEVAGYYQKIGFQPNGEAFLSIPCKLFTCVGN